MAEIIDTLVTEITYEADVTAIERAKVELKKLEAEQEKTAKSAERLEKEQAELAKTSDELAERQIALREKLAATAEKADKLKEEKKQLNDEIKKNGKATEEQKARLAEIDSQLAETTKETKEYRQELTRLGVEQAKVRKDQGQLSREQRRLGQSSRETSGNIAKLNGALEKASGSSIASSLNSWITGFAGVTIAIQAVVKAAELLYALGAAVIDTGMRFEGLRARLKTITGSVAGANAAFAQIQEFARTTPFELEDVTTAFSRLGAIGIKPTTEALNAYGNIAAARGKTMLEFIEAVADASTGEFERLKEFGIKASTQGDMVAFTFAGVTTRVKKDAREMTEYLQRLGETEFAGSMADQAATFSGQLSNVKDSWSQFLDSVAQQGPLDTASEGLTAFGAVLNDEVGETLAKILDGVMQKGVDMFEFLGEGTVNLTDTFSALGEILGLLGRALEPLIALWGLLMKGLMAAIQILGKGAELWNKLFDAISDLLRPVERLTNAWDSLKDAIGLAGEESQLWFEQETSLADSLIETYMRVARARGLITPVGQMSDEELNRKLQEGTLTEEEAAERERRIKLREEEEKQKEFEDQLAKDKEEKKKRGDEATRHIKDLSDDALRAMEKDATLSQKARDKATKELEDREVRDAKRTVKKASSARLQEMIDDVNVSERVKEAARAELDRRAKAGKKSADTEYKKTYKYQVEQQLDENARRMAQARAARALREGRITTGQFSEFETAEYNKLRENMQQRWLATGELPAGVEIGLRQISRLPNEADLAGRVAPPVISIQNNRYEIHGNEFTVAIEGQFASTPQEVARMGLHELRRGLNILLGEATPTPEKR